MKKIIVLICTCVMALCQTNPSSAQIIKQNNIFIGGDWMSFRVDAQEKDVYCRKTFANQPNVSFNYIPGSKKIELVSYFLKTDTLSLYRYTIMVDNKPIKLNQSFDGIPVTEKKFDKNFRNVNLGIYNIANKSLIVILYKTNHPDKIYKSIYFAKPIQPAKIEHLTKDIIFDDGQVGSTTLVDGNNKVTLASNNQALNIIKDKADFDFLYDIIIKQKGSGLIIFKSAAWSYENGYYDQAKEDFLPFVRIDKSLFKKSGDYEIIIQPSLKWNIPQKQIEPYVSRHTISITLDEENFSKKELFTYIGYSGALLGVIVGLIGVYIKRKNKKKLLVAQQKKEIAQLQLNSVRSQLNPHFLFNALAGIQNLMNKNEIDNANRYLSKFARLTRNVLDSKELISLTEEKTLLDDYLQMEQLRFGFQYTLKASSDLDTENNEIPAMLLQPFVENAVKHGIAEKGKDGLIEISFEKQSVDLVLQIKDNGQGFDVAKTYNGLGLALSKNRIALLNTIYKQTPFVLDIQSDLNGTVVTITLKQWL